jgi:hypothetical protein
MTDRFAIQEHARLCGGTVLAAQTLAIGQTGPRFPA